MMVALYLICGVFAAQSFNYSFMHSISPDPVNDSEQKVSCPDGSLIEKVTKSHQVKQFISIALRTYSETIHIMQTEICQPRDT